MYASLLALTASLALSSAAPVKIAPTALQMHQYQGLALDPKGERIATVESSEALETSKDAHGAIIIRKASDGAVIARFDPCPSCKYAGLSWSPTGDALAFVASDHKAGTAELAVAQMGAVRTVRTVVKLSGVAETPRWSPDGATIALLAIPGAHKEVGATQAGAAQVGEIGSIIDEKRIALVAAKGGSLRMVSPSDTFIYEYDWTPDGKGFVATAAKGDGDNNWWVAKLEYFGVDGSERVIAAPKDQMNYPRVSPDGKTVAFIGGIMSDFGSVGGDVWTVPLAGGTPKNLTPDFKGSFESIVWRGGAVQGMALAGDHMTTVRIDPKTGAVTRNDAPPFSFSAGDGKVSLSADGTIAAAVIQSFERAPEIFIHGAAGPHPITHENAALTPVAKATSISWKSGDYDVQGWLLAPLNADPTKKHPMIVLVHGGPSAAVTPTYVARGTVHDLLQHGFYVFQPNPRGSYGQGEAFTRANIRDFGGGDLSDILAGVDAVEKVAPIDDKRLGVYGHSYGGFMTMWTVTHSNRFKAAVAGAGIANWGSYYGENGIDTWMIPFFGGSYYEDPAIYDKLSPIRTIKNARTPTFIYVGERDVECPAAQSLEFQHGLNTYGVPNSLVIYAGEGHGIRKPENVKDLKDRINGWFDKYLGK